MALYLEINCPQCFLRGIKEKLDLNTSDFWECHQCRLQIASFNPVAVVLKFRGKGKFRHGQPEDRDGIDGLLLCEADDELPFLPKEAAYFHSEEELLNYLERISQ